MPTKPLDDALTSAAKRSAMHWKRTSRTLSTRARGPGPFGDRKADPYAMPRDCAEYNLLPDARKTALERFVAAKIAWREGVGRSPSNHLLSSQVQCANALAPLVYRPDAIKQLFGAVLPIDVVLPFGAVASTGPRACPVSGFDATDHVVFAWSGLEDHLRECGEVVTRGAVNQTYADAAIRVRIENGEIETCLIGWRYLERGDWNDSRARLTQLAEKMTNAGELGASRVRVLLIAPGSTGDDAMDSGVLVAKSAVTSVEFQLRYGHLR